MRKKKTHKEYVEELKIKNSTIEVIDQYIDAKTKILHHCLIHDVYWKISPTHALRGCGCSECQKDKTREKLSKTHDQYISELEKINSTIESIALSMV